MRMAVYHSFLLLPFSFSKVVGSRDVEDFVDTRDNDSDILGSDVV